MIFIKLNRIIRRNFGGYGNFVIWIMFVSCAVFTIDTILLPSRSARRPATSHRHARSPVVEANTREISNDGFLIADDNHQIALEDNQVDNNRIVNEIHDKKIPMGNDGQQPGQDFRSSELPNCGVTKQCPRGSYSYLVRSGYGRNIASTICFNGDYLVSESLKNNHRGMNTVIINEESLTVDDMRVFDVYFTDIGLLEYMKENMRKDQIVLIASQDEASLSLKEGGRKAIKELGSILIDDVTFRDNYVIIGKRGIPPGTALEKVQGKVNGSEFAEQVEIRGCLVFPLEKNEPFGKQRDLQRKDNNQQVASFKQKEQPSIYFDEELENCGLESQCGLNELSVRLYTGKQNKNAPKICVDGKYVLAGDLNGGGRGLNMVVVDPETKDIVHVVHFDTFSSDGTAMEMFLETLNDNELVLAVAYDEASTKLTKPLRSSIAELGSSFVQLLSFRDVWAFVGQKGIRGFSPIEKFSSSEATKFHLSWPEPIDLRTCVPLRLKPLKTKLVLSTNIKRRTFCRTFDGYGQFCNASVIDEFYTPPQLGDTTLEKHQLFQTPILLVAGLNHNAVRMQLEALFSNPGLDPRVVTVFHDAKFPESSELASVFDVKSVSLPSSVKYSDLLQKAIVYGWEHFPKSNYLIVLEEEVIPAADFLNFLRQCYDSIASDKTLIGASAWNPNGYVETSHDTSVAHRAHFLPGLGFLLKRSYYDAYMAKNMSGCCSSRSWEGWLMDQRAGLEMLLPEVSRVSRDRIEGQTMELVKMIFHQNRLTVEPSIQYEILNAGSLGETDYVQAVKKLIEKSTPLNSLGVDECLQNQTFYFDLNTLTSQSSSSSYTVFYESRDDRLLVRLCACFKLRGLLPKPRYGLHRGLLRFNQRGRIVLLIGSDSPYSLLKPSAVVNLQSRQIVN